MQGGKRRAAWGWIAGLACALGCGGTEGGAVDAGSGADAASDAGGDETRLADVLADAADAVDAAPACFGDAGLIGAEFTACHATSECTTATHRTDCCGSATIVGVNAASSGAFAACEAAWAAHFPPCGCPPRPAQTEDGKTPSAPSKVVVECTNFTSAGGVCRTSTAP